MGAYAMGWRSIMRAERKRQVRKIICAGAFSLGAIGLGAYGVVWGWPW